MILSDLLNNRVSTRAFTEQAIPHDQLVDIFELAQRSSSNCNVQPWQSMVVSGQRKEQIKQALIDEIMSGKQPYPDFDWTPKYQGKHRDRQFGSANALYNSLDIQRADKNARQASMLRNWQFFDAPHVAFFCMEKYLGIMGAVDMGIYAQTLSLILQNANISSCMQGALGQFPEPIRKNLEIPEHIGILFGMSFGYADLNAPVNKTKTTRVKIEDSVRFYQ